MGKDISRNLRISQTDSSMQKIRLKVELYLLELLMYHQLMKNLKLKGKNLKNLWKLYKFAKFPKEAEKEVYIKDEGVIDPDLQLKASPFRAGMIKRFIR